MKERFDRNQELKRQGDEFSKTPIPHNRHSGITTMGDLKERRSRRRWNRLLRETVESWNNAYNKAA